MTTQRNMNEDDPLDDFAHRPITLDVVEAVASSKSETWPASRSRCAATDALTASSMQPKSSARSWPTKSNAPDFTRLSSIFRFAIRESRRAQKSSSEMNSPRSSRSRITDSMAVSPTCLIAARP